MAGFEMSIEIGRPIQVFAVLADLENDVNWRREWVEAKNTSEGALGVGATTRLVSQALGRRMEVEYEVTDYEPDRLGTRVTIGYTRSHAGSSSG